MSNKVKKRVEHMRNNKYNNIYGMMTISKIEKRNKKVRIMLSVALLILAIILIAIILCISDNIKKQKQAKAYETQILQYKQQEEEKEKQKAEEEERKRKEKLPQITEQGKQNFETIYHSETKRVFLTFDDGPSTVTPTILQTLSEKGVKATFFMLGTNVEKMPDTVKQVYEQGHYIANHGYSHVYSSIYANPQSVLDEYNKANEVIQNALGEPEFNSHLFRFPGGYVGGKYADIKKEAKELLNQNDILNVDWNCLTGDAEIREPTSEYIMRRLQEISSGKNSLIILMHDAQAKKVTAEMLPQVIDYLAEQGYEFKTFYDIFE